MRKRRIPKETDQKYVEEGYQALYKMARELPHIEPTLWMSVVVSMVASASRDSGWTHKQFSNDMMDAIKHYKRFWD